MSHIPSLIYCCSKQQFLLYYQYLNRFQLRDGSEIEIFPQEFGLLEQYICSLLTKNERKDLLGKKDCPLTGLEQILNGINGANSLSSATNLIRPTVPLKDLLYNRLLCFHMIWRTKYECVNAIENITNNLFQITQSLWSADRKPNPAETLKFPKINLYFEDLCIPFPKIIWFPNSLLMKLPRQLASLRSNPQLQARGRNHSISIVLLIETCLSSDLIHTLQNYVGELDLWLDFIVTIFTNSNVDLIIAQQSIHPELLRKLHQAKIATISNISIRYVQPLAHLSGVRPIPSLASFLSSFRRQDTTVQLPITCLGYLRNVSILPMYQDSFILCEGFPPDHFENKATSRNNSSSLLTEPVISILLSNVNNSWSSKQLQLVIKDSLWFLTQLQRSHQAHNFLFPLSQVPISHSGLQSLFDSFLTFAQEIYEGTYLPIHVPLLHRFIRILLELKEYQ